MYILKHVTSTHKHVSKKFASVFVCVCQYNIQSFGAEYIEVCAWKDFLMWIIPNELRIDISQLLISKITKCDEIQVKKNSYKMDLNLSSSESDTNNNNNKMEHLISTIKDSLVDISVELADIKKSIKKNSERTVPNRLVSIESEVNFLRFDQEIQQNTEKFNEFMNVLEKIFSNNENEIKSNLPKYYSIVLRSCFNRNLMNMLSWNKYKDKLAVNSTRIFEAIQLSGSAVDSLSTEFDRRNILHKEFRKFKDSCRSRKGK